MEILNNLAYGFSVATQPEALLFCLLGVTLGTLVGVLPGIGSLAAISMCLPLTFYMDPLTGLIVLAGVFLWCTIWFVDSIDPAEHSRLSGSCCNLPRRLSDDQAGKAGQALFITTITSFIGGSVGYHDDDFVIACVVPIRAKLSRT